MVIDKKSKENRYNAVFSLDEKEMLLSEILLELYCRGDDEYSYSGSSHTMELVVTLNVSKSQESASKKMKEVVVERHRSGAKRTQREPRLMQPVLETSLAKIS
ncbi:hypothetical protein J6590_018759 [Homalodisca vitripennis]|nr:hypothetical protein J6590_018759 [Homalodisca vitripennis]